jgi:hypothetical protein
MVEVHLYKVKLGKSVQFEQIAKRMRAAVMRPAARTHARGTRAWAARGRRNTC